MMMELLKLYLDLVDFLYKAVGTVRIIANEISDVIE